MSAAGVSSQSRAEHANRKAAGARITKLSHFAGDQIGAA
jgi:hypothetical protein